MHALKTTTSHISLGIDSAEVSSHIILDSPACSRTGCGCRAFVEVSKTLVGGVTEEEYLVGVLKIKPSKSLAVALRQFRREKNSCLFLEIASLFVLHIVCICFRLVG